MLADVAAYITAHCADRLPLERLARIGCMGVSKLKDAFHARYGCTITQYIQGQRMERAEQLLANTDLPVGQIAQIVGYQNPSRFAQLFRRSTGRARQRSGRLPPTGSRVREHAGPKKPGGRKKDSRQLSACS